MNTVTSVVVGDFGASRRKAAHDEKMKRLKEIKEMTDKNTYAASSAEDAWLAATMKALDAGDLTWEIADPTVVSKFNGKPHSSTEKLGTQHKKVADIYSIFLFMRPLLLSVPQMRSVEKPDGSFDIEAAEKLSSKTIKKFLKDVPLEKSDQLFFCFSFLDADIYRTKGNIIGKMNKLRVKMFKWFSRNGRHLSRAKSYSESIEDQQERLMKSCFALLCADGSKATAMNLLKTRYGSDYECNMHNDKRRIERVMGLKGQDAEDFWKW